MYLNFQVPLNTDPSLSDTVLRIRRGSSIPPRLQSCECHFNWAKSYPLTPNEINHGLLLLEEKFRDQSSEIESIFLSKADKTTGRTPGSEGGGGRSSINYLILLIAEKLTQAYFNIEISNFSQAEECLAEAEYFLSRCEADGGGDEEDDENGVALLFPPDYSQGFTYIIEGIKLFLEIQINTVGSGGGESGSMSGTGGGTTITTTATSSRLRTSKVSLGGLKHFKRLPAKAKFIVWTVRDVFFIYSFRSNVERSDWMESILDMEPYSPNWHFYLYRALHGARKLMPRPIPVLLLEEEGEQERILTRWSGSERNGNGLDGGRDGHSCPRPYHDPLSISYQAMCITQMFIERRTPPPPRPPHHHQPQHPSPISPRSQYPWRFGKTLFENPFQVMSDIQQKTIQVLEMDCHLDGVYLNFSGIHLFQLPPEHQSMELVHRCLKKALRLNSANPKAHYRMGLAQFKLKNHKQAMDHFREGIKNPNNIGAIFGLLQLLMAEPVENALEIQSILKYAMRNRELTKVWDKRVLRTLHYLKGCFHFMQQEKDIDEAITSWIIAHDNESPKWSYYFHNLSHQSFRFGWPTKRLNLTNVSKALKHVAYLERTQFRQLLLDICSEVDDAIRRDERKSSLGNIYG